MRDEIVSKAIKFSLIRVFVRNKAIKCRPAAIRKREALTR